jgi:hypothetical protein
LIVCHVRKTSGTILVAKSEGKRKKKQKKKRQARKEGPALEHEKLDLVLKR